MAEKMLTVKEVAEQLSLSKRCIQNWLSIGEIRGYKLGQQWRIKESDLNSWLERRENQHVSPIS